MCMDPRGVMVIEAAHSAAGIDRPVLALERIANRPIADHVLDSFIAAGIDDVIVAAPSDVLDRVAEALSGERAPAMRLSYVGQPAPVDVIDGLRLAAPFVEDRPCVVHLANGLLSEPLQPFVDRLELDAPDIVLMVHEGAGPDERLSSATQDMLRIAELN